MLSSVNNSSRVEGKELKEVLLVPWFDLLCRRTSHHAILNLLELQSQKRRFIKAFADDLVLTTSPAVV